MSLGVVERGTLYLKEIQEIGLFSVMVDSRLFLAFSASPFYYVMLPLIGLLFTVLALIQAYKLYQSSNKNFDKWSHFLVSSVCAVLASISLYGAVLSMALGFTFTLGPWFFLSSVLVAFIHQVTLFGLNLFRAYESIKGSGQRMHYIQAVLNNVFILSLLTAVLGAVTFVMLLPIAPYVAAVFAASAVVLTAANIVWRLMPHHWKQAIKAQLHLGKPEVIQSESVNQTPESLEASVVRLTEDTLYHRLFSRCDYSAEVKALGKEQGTDLLRRIINNKITILTDKSEKSTQKVGLLNKLLPMLSNDEILSKTQILDEFPLAFESFWTEKGDVEQIFDAVIVCQSIEFTRDVIPVIGRV